MVLADDNSATLSRQPASTRSILPSTITRYVLRGCASASGEMLPRAGDELASVGLFEAKDVGDLAV